MVRWPEEAVSDAIPGVSISAVLVPTGIADDLMGFFCDSWRIVGPVCGAMPADYYLSRGKWSGPQRGING